MSRFLSLSSQRSPCGALTRCVSCLESLYADDGTSGMNEVGLALSISRAFSIGCSSVDPLDSLTSLWTWSRRDEQEEHGQDARMLKARALGTVSCLIRWGKHLSQRNLFEVIKRQANIHDTKCSLAEQSLGLTPSQTIELLRTASDLGDSFAMGVLSACFLCGYLLPQDIKNGAKLLQQATDLGNTGEMFILTLCYEKGDDKSKAIQCYQQASDLGNTDAMFNLATCYEKGDHISQDKLKAILLYQQASDFGNTDAMVNLATCYEKGDGVPQNRPKAIQLYQQAADLGNTCAMVTLGTCYWKGDGVAQDKSKAIQLYQQASDLGNTDGMFKLAYCFLQEDGVPQDKSKAIQLYQKASDLGHTHTMAQLKRYHEESHNEGAETITETAKLDDSNAEKDLFSS